MDARGSSARRPGALARLERIAAARPRLEIISREPDVPSAFSPVLFVHGAWHGAWCWDEHFLGHFAARGFSAHAVSLRGHGASEGRAGLRFCRIRDYVEDVAAAAAVLPAAPILVGHSLGAFVVQKYLERTTAPLAILLASVPPTGAAAMLRRWAGRRPLDLVRAGLTLSLLPLVADPPRARRFLFSADLPPEDVARHHARMQDEALAGFLDSLLFDLVDTSRVAAPVAVIGARGDELIDERQIAATARSYGVAPIFVEGAHDIMLDVAWRDAADAVIGQIERRCGAQGARARRSCGLRGARR